MFAIAARMQSARVGSCKRKAPNAPPQTFIESSAQLAPPVMARGDQRSRKILVDGRLFVFHFPSQLFSLLVNSRCPVLYSISGVVYSRASHTTIKRLVTSLMTRAVIRVIMATEGALVQSLRYRRPSADKRRTRAMSSNPCTSQAGLYCESYGSGDPMLFCTAGEHL